MKKMTMALIGIPAILVGSIAMAGMGHGDGDRCDNDREHKKHEGRYDDSNRGERRLDALAERLDLTKEQKEQVKSLFDAKEKQRAAMRDKMQELHDMTRNLNPDSADYAKQLNEAKQIAADLAISRIDEQASMRAEMAKILTPEQQTQMAKMFDRFQDGDKGPRGPM